MQLMYLALFLFIMMVPMSAAFADNGDCWFIFCWFENLFEPKEIESKQLTPEEIYVKEQQKVKSKLINQMEEEISSLKESKKILSQGKDLEIIPEINVLNDGIDNRINFLQGILDTAEDVKNNPSRYLTQSDLVKRAMNYYKVMPDGTPCDDDRRWVEDVCRPMKRANKIFYSWDLEWLRDHPELDNWNIGV